MATQRNSRSPALAAKRANLIARLERMKRADKSRLNRRLADALAADPKAIRRRRP